MQERRREVRRQADRDLMNRVRQLSSSNAPRADDGELKRQRRRAIRHNVEARMALVIRTSTGGSDQWDVHEHPIKGRVLDLSEGGCSVFVGRQLDMGQEINLAMVLGGGQEVRTRGAIRWVKAIPAKNGFACGVQFGQMAAKDVKGITKFLKQMDDTVGL